MKDMQMKENSRLIKALREIGWTDTQINELVLFIEDEDLEALEKLKEIEKQKHK